MKNNLCENLFIVLLYEIANYWEKNQWPPISGRLNKLWNTQSVEMNYKVFLMYNLDDLSNMLN